MREEFLEALPKFPPHYCRKSTDKLYLEQTIHSMANLYQLYVEKCEAENQTPLSNRLLKEEFDNMNLSLFQPKKDKCDTCVMFETGNLTEDQWKEHRQKKDSARDAKSHDKDRLTNDGRLKVLSMDLQAVLLSPCLQASALYYKTKLCVHNFTIFDLRSHDVSCYVWHEGEAGLNASEFASCVANHLERDIANFDEIILYSDGCTYQNRNVVLANTLTSLAQKHNTTIIQKYLEKGHTQMEVDSFHSVTEKAERR